MAISGVLSGAGLPAAALLTKKSDSPARIHEAAQQFESLMISQMLKSMRESEDSWLGTGDDSAGSTAVEMAEEELAKSISLRGGLGLAELVEAGLMKSASTPRPGIQKLME
jgi:Rod binding domain-containing protein